MAAELDRDEVLQVVDRAIEELLKSAAVKEPPVDAIALAQGHLGMVVVLDRRQESRGRAQRVAGRKQIVLRPEPREERHQWTVAHEIGEHMKANLLASLGIDPEAVRPMAGESLANLFATHLLTPTTWFAADAVRLEYDILDLKQRYTTASHEVIALRLLDLPAPCVITIVDNDEVSKRKSNAWPVKKRQLAAAETECQQYVSEHGEAHRVRKGRWTVQGWPVHQRDWKRQILRSVADEDE